MPRSRTERSSRMSPTCATPRRPIASRGISPGIVARAIDRAPEGKRSEEALRIAAELIRRLQQLADGKHDLERDEPLDPAQVFVALLQRLPDGRAAADRAPAHAAARHDRLHERARRAGCRPRASRRGPVGRRHRCASWRSSAGAACGRDRCAPRGTARRASRCASSRRRTRTAPSSARSTSSRELGAQIKVSYDTSSTRLHAKAWLFHARERLLDRLHRLVEPDPLGAGARARVERARLGRSQSGRRREDGRRLRELLGEPRLRRLRRRRVRATDRGRPASATSTLAEPDRDRAPAVPGGAARARRARPAPGPPSQPARRRHRNRQDRDGGGRLRAPSGRARRAAACSSSRTARRSSTRAARPSGTRCATRAFGEKWVGGQRPSRFEHVFASIQSLNAPTSGASTRAHFDVVDRRRVPPRGRAVVRGAARAPRSRSSCSA